MAYQTHPLVNAPYTPTITLTVEITPARYKIEWIYTRTKVSGPENLELALIMKRKKKERLRNGHFFEHLVPACTIDLMDDLGLTR